MSNHSWPNTASDLCMGSPQGPAFFSGKFCHARVNVTTPYKCNKICWFNSTIWPHQLSATTKKKLTKIKYCLRKPKEQKTTKRLLKVTSFNINVLDWYAKCIPAPPKKITLMKIWRNSLVFTTYFKMHSKLFQTKQTHFH